MMKKIIAMILSLAMLLCAVAAAAEGYQGKTTLGTLSVNGAFMLKCSIPEGYEYTPVPATAEQMVGMFSSEDETKPVMVLSVAYDEQYSDVERTNDLTEEELKHLEQTFIDNDPEVSLSFCETGYGTMVLVAQHDDENADYLDFFSIFRGYCIEFVLMNRRDAEDRNLQEGLLDTCLALLTDLDFVPVGETLTPEEAIAGLKFITNLSEYDAENNTVRAQVMKAIPLPAAQAEALQVGDMLIDGQYQEQIETLEKTEEGDIIINENVELRKDGEEYRVFVYELEWIEPYADLTVEIPDNLVIKDNIDKDTGDPLDEPVTYTVDEFKEMLAAETYPDFATDNVWVSFNVNREIVSVERFYTPAQ